MEAWKYHPARDLGLPPARRWRSVWREDGLVETAAHAAWWSAVAAYLKTAHRLRVEGREHLPASTPFVLAANHSSHLDVLALAGALPAALRRSVLPLAAGDFFFETPAMAAFAAFFLNALPLWRKKVGRHAMEDLRKRLLEDRCGYILFPEGTRSRTGEMAEFKPGLGMIVAGTDVPVVPCHIAGAHDAWPVDRHRPRPAPVGVRVGVPLRFSDVPNTREGWVQVARETEAAVRRLAAGHAAVR
jgi:1-acyl-sn-glycerol-3-phosphate acyltransferase